MIRVQVRRVVARPIEVVFNRLAAIDDYGQWLPPSVIFRDTRLVHPDDPVRTGTEFYDFSNFGRLWGEVTDYAPPRMIAFRQRLTLRGFVAFESFPSYSLTSDDDHTHVDHVGRARFFGMYRMLEPVGRLMARRERRRVVDALQESLEQV